MYIWSTRGEISWLNSTLHWLLAQRGKTYYSKLIKHWFSLLDLDLYLTGINPNIFTIWDIVSCCCEPWECKQLDYNVSFPKYLPDVGIVSDQFGPYFTCSTMTCFPMTRNICHNMYVYCNRVERWIDIYCRLPSELEWDMEMALSVCVSDCQSIHFSIRHTFEVSEIEYCFDMWYMCMSLSKVTWLELLIWLSYLTL